MRKGTFRTKGRLRRSDFMSQMGSEPGAQELTQITWLTLVRSLDLGAGRAGCQDQLYRLPAA